MKPSHLLGPAERLHLERAIVEAERATRGELVVVVVRACDSYATVGWRLGVLLAGLAFLALALFAPPLAPWLLLSAQAGALGVAHALVRFDPIRRALVRDGLLEERAAERARRAFAESGLTRSAGRCGILLFVALLERRVVVLAGEGIHRALGPDESWQEVVQIALDGLRQGEAARGLEAAVRRCGEILTRHLPAPARELSGLPQALVLEDD
jgi:putative membrane protein